MKLLSARRRGDDQAGERLLLRHYAPIERFFLNKARDSAKDLIQRTFLVLLEVRHKINAREGDGEDVRRYLFGIAPNTLLTHFRSVRRTRERVDPSSHSVEDLSPGAHAWIVRNQRAQQLLRALRPLPLDQQIVLELYYWEELKARELAEILQMPEGSVRTVIRRAKQQLGLALGIIACSPAELQETLSSLDSWVRKIREHLDGLAGLAVEQPKAER